MDILFITVDKIGRDVLFAYKFEVMKTRMPKLTSMMFSTLVLYNNYMNQPQVGKISLNVRLT